MGVIEVTYYQAVCDACGINITEHYGDEITAWGDDGQAVDQVEDWEGYVIVRGKGNPMTVICRKCRTSFETTCSEQEVDDLAERTPEMEAAITEWAAAQLRTAKAGL